MKIPKLKSKLKNNIVTYHFMKKLLNKIMFYLIKNRIKFYQQGKLVSPIQLVGLTDDLKEEFLAKNIREQIKNSLINSLERDGILTFEIEEDAELRAIKITGKITCLK